MSKQRKRNANQRKALKNLCTNYKANQEIDYFIAWPGMVANRKVSEKHQKY